LPERAGCRDPDGFCDARSVDNSVGLRVVLDGSVVLR
jgi:hypothetical protein